MTSVQMVQRRTFLCTLHTVFLVMFQLSYTSSSILEHVNKSKTIVRFILFNRQRLINIKFTTRIYVVSIWVKRMTLLS